MGNDSKQIFRAAVVERLSSPEQLDQLLRVTNPFDWAAVLVIWLGFALVLFWGVTGRIPTRVTGEGILVSDGGRVIDAVSAVGSRLASIEVTVGDHVRQGQVVAQLVQTDTEHRYRDAEDVLHEREQEYKQLSVTVENELAAKSVNFDAQRAGLEQAITADKQRAAYLDREVKLLEGVVSQGFITRRFVEDRRHELTDTQQRITDAGNEVLRLNAQQLDLQVQRNRDRQALEFRVNEARRQVAQLGGALDRDSRVVSPIDGQVIEIKVAAGAVVAVGTPVVEIESEGTFLAANIYIPADRGKNVKPGMEVRIEPATVRREEYGALIGRVASISEFPVTPKGMAAALNNEALVSRFARDGAPYAALVELERDGRSANGYRWSSRKGPPVSLSAGTLTRAEITIREQPPYSLVLPVIRRLTGIGG